MKDLGEAQYKVLKDHKNKKLMLSQATYIDKFLVKYVMQDSKKHGIPLFLDQCLKTPEEKERMQAVPYASTMDSLMYVMLCTRPNIFFDVLIISKYQYNPNLEYWTVVKHILKYLRSITDYMLVF